MSVAVELSDEVVSHARREGAANGRSVAEQIEFQAQVFRAAEANPDLPIEFIKGILKGKAELEAGEVSTYELGPNK